MLSLAYDRGNQVLRVTITGVFASNDLEQLDRLTIEFVARHGQVRGIFDYSDVDVFAVPETRMIQCAQQPVVVRERVFVASRALRGEGARLYGHHQREAGEREATIVDSLDEAYQLLRLRNPRFEPVER